MVHQRTYTLTYPISFVFRFRFESACHISASESAPAVISSTPNPMKKYDGGYGNSKIRSDYISACVHPPIRLANFYSLSIFSYTFFLEERVTHLTFFHVSPCIETAIATR